MKNSMKYKYILFDLDGTLCKSAEGIRHSLERMLATLGVEGVDLSDYTKYIGPPLLDTLRGLCGLPEELRDEGYSLYRDFYEKEGRALNRPFEGIETVLAALREKGARLAVCSSKLEPTAETVMSDLKLDGYFDAICGSNRDSTRKDKRDLIPYAVERLGGTRDDFQRTVMLGDTFYDAQGAQECGVDFVACAYGYGSNAEMEKYRPVAWAYAVDELPGVLL